MASYTVNAPDGHTVHFDAPDNSSAEQIRTLAARALKQSNPNASYQRPVLEKRITEALAPKDQGSISAPPWSLSNTISQKVSGALSAFGMDEGHAARLGDKVTSALSDLTPVGGAVEADQARQSWNEGNYLGAAGHGALAALSAIPDGGGVAHSIIAPLFHGSPHKFEKFALEKIGTGEGAQAYGHGLYFAENPDVAKEYQQKLARPNIAFDGSPIKEPRDFWAAQDKLEAEGDWRTGKALNELFNLNRTGLDAEAALKEMRNTHRNDANMLEAISSLSKRVNVGPREGHLYEVKLDANPEDFLDWDAPEWKQPAAVQRLLRERAGYTEAQLTAPLPRVNETKTGKFTALNVWGEPIGTFADRAKAETKSLAAHQRQYGGMLAYQKLGGNSIYHHLDSGEASRALWEAGVPGTRYLDQGSRGAGAGTSNYVVFNPDLIDILRRY